MEIHPVNALRDNYIWVLVEASSRSAWAVDPGEASPLLAFCDEHGLTLKGVLLTHHHPDHSGGIEALKTRFPGLTLHGAKNSPVTSLTHRLEDGDTFHCGPFLFRALAIPGHTLDHMAFFGNHALFCGDTLFSGGCGRIFEGSPEMMYASLQKLMALPQDTDVYCGHEYTLANLAFAAMVEPWNPATRAKIQQVLFEGRQGNSCTLPSRLGDEITFNPFLRCEEREVIAAAETYAKKRLKTALEVFSVLREWKNHFIASPAGIR